MILYDKGPLTKSEVFAYLRPIEVTDCEFDMAWKFADDLGMIRTDYTTDSNGKTIWRWKVDPYHDVSGFRRFISKMWDELLEPSPITTYSVKFTCKKRDIDRILNDISNIPEVSNTVLKEIKQ